jgi:putative addiction module component (TIGR02574 family)
LLADALALPEDERERLLRALIDSLDGPASAVTSDTPEAIAADWDAEIERRVADDERDDLDGPSVMSRLRAEIRGR